MFEFFDCITILDLWHLGYITRKNNLYQQCAEFVSVMREDQSAFPKSRNSARKITTELFTVKLARLIFHQRKKGHESINILDLVEELQTQSNSNWMPQFKMLFGSMAAIRVLLLQLSSILVHNQSAKPSLVTLK